MANLSGVARNTRQRSGVDVPVSRFVRGSGDGESGDVAVCRLRSLRPQKPRPEPRLTAFESRSPSPRPCEAAITACHGSALTAFGFWAKPSTSLLAGNP